MLATGRGAAKRLSALRGLVPCAVSEASSNNAAFTTAGAPKLSPKASPWQRQARAQLTSSTTLTPPAWAASAAPCEAQQVEEWLLSLQLVDAETRAVCAGLLARNHGLLYNNAARVTSAVQILMDATRQKRLLRPWVMQDAQILAIADRYTPDALRARLNELHRYVWEELDNSDVGSLYRARSSLDFLDLDARSLAFKAQKLRELVPEFLPSTILRSCPELLDVLPEDLPAHIHRAGSVVVVGANVRAEMRANTGEVVIITAVPPSSGGSLRAPMLSARAFASSAAPAPPPQPKVLRVVGDARTLVYADATGADIRYTDPYKTEEELVTGGQLAPLRMCRVALGGR